MEDNEESEEEESEGDDIGNSDDEQEKEECLDNDEEVRDDSVKCGGEIANKNLKFFIIYLHFS